VICLQCQKQVSGPYAHESKRGLCDECGSDSLSGRSLRAYHNPECYPAPDSSLATECEFRQRLALCQFPVKRTPKRRDGYDWSPDDEGYFGSGGAERSGLWNFIHSRGKA